MPKIGFMQFQRGQCAKQEDAKAASILNAENIHYLEMESNRSNYGHSLQSDATLKTHMVFEASLQAEPLHSYQMA